MFTDNASSSHISDRVYKKKNTASSNTPTTPAMAIARSRAESEDGGSESRAGASERAVTGGEASPGSASQADSRHYVARECFEAVGTREVAEPQHELATPRVDVGLHLLPHHLGRADEVVAHVLVVRTAAHSDPPPGESSHACISASASNTMQSGPCVRVIVAKSRPISSQYCASSSD